MSTSAYTICQLYACVCTTHMVTHYKTQALLVMGWWKGEEPTKSVCRREEVGFQFWLELKEESETECLTERRTQKTWFHVTGLMYWFESIFSQGSFYLSSEQGRSEYLTLSKKSEKQSREEATCREMKHIGEVWRSCSMYHYQKPRGSRWELFCIESSYQLVASGEQRVKEWCGRS